MSDIPKILFIQGVYLNDGIFLNDVLEEQMIKKLNISESHQEEILPDKLPYVYTGVENWPTTTNIPCWYCDLNFEGRPKFIPISIELIDGKYHMPREAVLCSFGCGFSYIDLYYHKCDDNIEKKNMLKLLRKDMTRKDSDEAEPAPSKYIMKKYGGDITESEYKNMIKKAGG